MEFIELSLEEIEKLLKEKKYPMMLQVFMIILIFLRRNVKTHNF